MNQERALHMGSMEGGAARDAPVAAPRTLHDEIAALLRDFSVEKTPGELARRDAWPAGLPKGSRVYVTWIAGNDFGKTLRAAVRLRQFGMEPVPHLAVRARLPTRTRSKACSPHCGARRRWTRSC